MTINAAPWVKETCSTTGTGALILSGNVDSYLKFSDGLSATDEVYYAIQDSNGNRETGIGTFDGTNSLVRTTVSATLTAGVYDNTTPTPLSLSGESIVICTFTAEAFKALLAHVNPNDFGIGIEGGAETNPFVVTSFNAAKTSGICFVNGNVADGPNNSISERGTLLVMTESNAGSLFYGSQTFIERDNSKMWFRNCKADVFSAWQETFHSGNSVNPLDYGIGGNGGVIAGDNANNLVEGGIYRATSSMSNLGFVGTSTIIASRSFNVVSQIQTDGNKIFMRRSTDTGATWTSWAEVYNSNNSVNPLDFGLGTNAPLITDFNATDRSGSQFMGATSAAAINPPSAITNNWAGLRSQRFSTTFFEFWAGLTSNQYYARSFSGSYRDWVEFYTSGNSVNPLDYGIGVSGLQVFLSDLDSITTGAGLYRIDSGTTGAKPTGITTSSTVFVEQLSSSLLKQTLTYIGGTLPRTFTRSYNVTWSIWLETFDEGNSVNPLNIGWGYDGTNGVANNAPADLNGIVASGVYRITGTTITNLPTGIVAGASLTQTVYDTNDFSQTVIAKDGSRMYFRTQSGGVWKVWQEIYHSGNSVNPLDYGLKTAVTLSITDNLDNFTETGFWFNGTAGNTAGNNYPISSAGSLLVIARSSTNVTQEFVRYADGVASGKWFRSRGTASWSDWAEIFTSTNSVNPLDYGLGSDNPAVLTDLGLEVAKAGFYEVSNLDIGPYLMSGSAMVMKRGGDLNTIIASGIGGSLGNNDLVLWAKTTSAQPNDYGTWEELFHSGNANFHIFGDNGTGNRIASGTVINATTVFFELHLNSITPATGFNIQGTFKIVAHDGTTDLVTGLTSTAFSSSNSRPSNKLITILVTVASGLTSKDTVYLETASADSRIRVDF